MATNLRTGLRQSIKSSLETGLVGSNIFGTSTLDLRFAQQKSLGPRVTFTRASTGTFVGSDGLIKSAVTNLLLRSEEFDNASWTNFNTTESSNVAVAPNGTLTADKLIENSGAGFKSIDQAVATSALTYTFSVYVKAVERSIVQLLWSGGASTNFANFNLATGTVTAGTYTSATITPAGSNWFRLSITSVLAPGTYSGIISLQTNASAARAASYTGDGTSGLFIWGAQLEQSSTVGEYTPTTSTINSAPRFDHNPTTGESLGLLVEEARTNLLLNSATLSTQSVTVAAAANTLSFYGTGTVTLTGVSTAGPLVGTGANNRVSLTFTPTAGSLTLTVSGSVTNAQLEAGAFPTSYIPTTSATVTRAADVASITGAAFSSFYNQTEGTLFADSVQANITPTSRIVSVSDNTSSNRVILTRASALSGNISLTVTNAGTAQVAGVLLGSSLAAGTSNKVAAGYKAADFAGSVNGLTPVTQGTGTVPSSLTQLTIGNGDVLSNNLMNGTIKRLTYWPTRLANTTLQQITQP